MIVYINTHRVTGRFIQQWIYEGVCADPEEEFGIVVHDGHKLFNEVGCCPVFFSQEFSPTLFSAGKSLHLLKLCNPNVGVVASIREHL